MPFRKYLDFIPCAQNSIYTYQMSNAHENCFVDVKPIWFMAKSLNPRVLFYHNFASIFVTT